MGGTRRAGFVLAGGASSRMGVNKAFLPVNDRPMVVRAAEMAAKVAGSVMLVGDPAIYGHLGFEVTRDLRLGCGPLAGIEAALTITDAEFNLIVACDLPGLSEDLLEIIFKAAEGHPEADATMPAGPEPLCAVYRKRALADVREALDRGVRKVTDAFDKARIHIVAVADARAFANLNTPDEWRRYTQE